LTNVNKILLQYFILLKHFFKPKIKTLRNYNQIYRYNRLW